MEINRDPISKWPKRAVKTVSPENLREQPIREQFHPPSNFQLLFVLKVIAYSFKKFLLKEDSLILGFYGWSVIFFKQFYCKILIQIPVLGIDMDGNEMNIMRNIGEERKKDERLNFFSTENDILDLDISFF